MEKITKYGITAFWHEDLENGSKLMQKAFDEQYPFYQSILNANKSAKSNSDFVKILEDDVLSEKVPVYNNEGKLIEVRPATADELQRTIFEPLRQLKPEKTGTND